MPHPPSSSRLRARARSRARDKRRSGTARRAGRGRRPPCSPRCSARGDDDSPPPRGRRPVAHIRDQVKAHQFVIELHGAGNVRHLQMHVPDARLGRKRRATHTVGFPTPRAAPAVSRWSILYQTGPASAIGCAAGSARSRAARLPHCAGPPASCKFPDQSSALARPTKNRVRPGRRVSPAHAGVAPLTPPALEPAGPCCCPCRARSRTAPPAAYSPRCPARGSKLVAARLPGTPRYATTPARHGHRLRAARPPPAPRSPRRPRSPQPG